MSRLATSVNESKTLMFISSSDYTELESKGVAAMMRDRDEGGFFHRVISVHPWAKSSRTIAISPNQDLLEFGPEWLPFARRSRLFRRMLAPAIIARSALSIRNVLRRDSVSVVRASDPFWTALLAWSVTRATGVPLAVSIHADWIQRARLDRRAVPRLLGSFRLARLLARFTLRQADFVIVIRESLVDEAVRLGAPPERVLVMPHVVEDELFHLSSDTDVSASEAPYAFFAGRLSRENYVYDMLESLRLVPEDLGLQLVLAGEGVEARALAELIARDPFLQGRVTLLGPIPRQDVQVWRQGATANLCLMGGYSLIEAAASARPVIAYDVEWHSELVVDGQTGFLVREGDVPGVAEALATSAMSPDLAQQLGVAAREHARQRHARSNVASVRRQVYERVLSCRRA